MIPGIKRQEVPDWILQTDGTEKVPIRDLLQGSLYYPASGRDGDPVRYLGGLVHSFVYVDDSIEHDDMMKSLYDERYKFKGYSLLGCRDVTKADLTPNGWRPVPPGPGDGNPRNMGMFRKAPYAIWSIHERNSDRDQEYGPKRFSLLNVCGDGAASFQALYHTNECAPDVVAIIQSGGGNWTEFRDPSKVFGRDVLENPNGTPRFLLYGGWGDGEYRPSCWPRYSEEIHHWSIAGGKLGLWWDPTSSPEADLKRS